MTEPVAWAIIWWICYHACWLQAIKLSAQMSPEQLVDDAIARAINRMKAIERQHGLS